MCVWAWLWVWGGGEAGRRKRRGREKGAVAEGAFPVGGDCTPAAPTAAGLPTAGGSFRVEKTLLKGVSGEVTCSPAEPGPAPCHPCRDGTWGHCWNRATVGAQ